MKYENIFLLFIVLIIVSIGIAKAFELHEYEPFTPAGYANVKGIWTTVTNMTSAWADNITITWRHDMNLSNNFTTNSLVIGAEFNSTGYKANLTLTDRGDFIVNGKLVCFNSDGSVTWTRKSSC